MGANIAGFPRILETYQNYSVEMGPRTRVERISGKFRLALNSNKARLSVGVAGVFRALLKSC